VKKKLLVPALLVQLVGTSAALGWIVLRKPAPHGAKPAAEAAAHAADAQPPAPSAHPPAHPPGGAPAGHEANGPEHRGGEQVLGHLMEGNRRFAAGMHLARPLATERAALVAGQRPGAIVLSCSDSRVPPELVFDQSLGDLFVVRTAGNVADAVALGSLEYAAEHLHARLLLVLGHERCGAVTAAAEDGEPESPNLKALVAAISPSVKPLKARAKGPELVHLGVEANVEASLAHVLASSAVLRGMVERKELTVKRGIYDLESGTVRTW
jgi:carbonic anhydrase